MEERGIKTAYALAKLTEGRVSLSTVYRLKRHRGRMETFDNGMVEALCDAFGVGPGELFERDSASKRRSKQRV